MKDPFEKIPYGRQYIDEADERAVLETLRSDFLTQGPAVERFERALADFTDATYATAVSNATAALHLACLAADLGPGDVLWTSPNTFVASANCGRYCGATVDFVDVDPVTYNLRAESLREKLVEARRTGRLPKVVVVVHFSGQSCDMKEIGALALEYGFTLIEDASHAIGGSYQGSKVGSCAYSDMTVFSFHPVKIVTTCEGGAITTRSKELHSRLARLRSHGITRSPELMRRKPEGPAGWYYEQIDLGFNYRLSDLHAALGISQLGKIELFIERRHALADRYDRLLGELPLILPRRIEDRRSSLHLYVVQVDPDRTRRTRAEIYERMRAASIEVNVHYIPVHTQPYYRDLGFRDGQFPVAETYYSRALTLPLFYSMSDSDQDRVVSTLRSAFA